MFFSKHKKDTGNMRRKRAVVKPVKRPLRWVQPLLRGTLVSSAIILCGFGVWKLNAQLSVSYWDVDAEAHVQQQIEDYLTQQQYRDYWHTRAPTLQSELMQRIPDIEHVQVSRVLPDGLLIKAKARKPMALWKDESRQQVMLIDDKGVAYRALQRGESIDLPVLRVEVGQLQSASQVLNTLNQYDVRKLLNLSELIAFNEGWRLNFAKGEQWFIKMANLEHDVVQVINVLNKPRWAKGHWRIDARVSERWFIRPVSQGII